VLYSESGMRLLALIQDTSSQTLFPNREEKLRKDLPQQCASQESQGLSDSMLLQAMLYFGL